VWRWPADSAPGRAATIAEDDEILTLPDKPSIAVLPFQNMSGDPEQEYFADGMTEDIITELSQFRSLFVIARNSTFAYKDRSPDVRDVARELGVRYVLEGSVRRGGERIRITGQLIHAESGNHIWADRYDRELEDIFTVQDEVTAAIVAAIAPEIGNVERERSQRKSPDNFDAWGHYQRGLAAYYSSTEEGHRSAIELFDRANDIDPTFAPAFAMAATARTRYLMHFMPENSDEILNQAREKAHKAITLDPQDSMCLWNDGRVHSILGHHDVAIAKVEDAVSLNPNDAMARYILGAVLCSAGRSEEAIPHVDHAIRLSPRDIFLTGMLFHRALMLFHLERYEESFEWVQRASLSANPRPLTFALFAAVLVKLGRAEEARAALKNLLLHAPGTTCNKFQGNPMFGGSEVLERFVGALREAGLPED
jgi:adenylate cyclase